MALGFCMLCDFRFTLLQGEPARCPECNFTEYVSTRAPVVS